MTSLAYTCASRECSTVALPGADVAGTDAPALEETSHPRALHSQESCRRCARRRGSPGLRDAIRHRIRAHVCRHTRRREEMVTLWPYDIAHEGTQARGLSWRVGSAGAARGADAADEMASGRPRRSGRGQDARRAVGARRRGAIPRRVFCERGESRGSDVRVSGPSCGPLLQLSRASSLARAVYPPDSLPGSAPGRARRSLVLVRLLKRDARRTTRIAHIARARTARAS
jgi:hypothetical protein